MLSRIYCFLFFFITGNTMNSLFAQVTFQLMDTTTHNYALVIHGGAGTILKSNMTPELEKAYKNKLQEALNAGEKILKSGGSSLEAVRASIKIMEDSPLFNAGKGAVYTHRETHELDASIMMGDGLKAGAVGGVTNVKNPIELAISVMEKSQHVFLIGRGAEEFAKENGLEMVGPSYFADSIRLQQLRKLKGTEQMMLDHDGETGSIDSSEIEFNLFPDSKYGTVGAVALDKMGNIVAGTSTGGMTNKKYGRIGDSPIIGAGTYADNNTCGISATGHGEYFIRLSVAKDIAAMMEYSDKSLEQAAQIVIQDKLTRLGGSGGVIGLDANGNIIMEFNTPGMYRGYAKRGEKSKVMLYK